MKGIVMTTQDAREFEKLGGLTITKQIKPAPRYIERAEMLELAPGAWSLAIKGKEAGEPDLRALGASDGVADVFAPPVEAGDIVFLREPWHRLTNPGNGEPSDRVILAADSTVAEGQTSYKWSSPVSMPEEAARRFAVVSKVTPIYNENVSVWEITMEAVSKEAAKAGETGALPYSDAPSPEEGSSYYTYAGDMSQEDRERMIAEIDKDRARLAEVQNRLLWVEIRHREISLRTSKTWDDDNSGERDALVTEDIDLAVEQERLAKEETDLRRALEDAGAPAPTLEEYARGRVAEIQRRRAEICDLLNGSTNDEKREELAREYECLDQEGDEIIKFLGDMKSPEADNSPGEDTAATDGEPAAMDLPEDEEVGSYTLGKCRYCGREWGVTLEGAKGGGYPTQKTADAAATRVCDCPEAVEKRKPEIGVAFAVTRGSL